MVFVSFCITVRDTFATRKIPVEFFAGGFFVGSFLVGKFFAG
jgi:hypothetical protein